MSSANETRAEADTDEQRENPSAEAESARGSGDGAAPSPVPTASRARFLITLIALAVIIAATLAVVGAGLTRSADQRREDGQRAAEQAAADWVTLLLTIPGEPLAGNAQMEQMKRGTADPLRSRFEATMSPYFQDYAPRADQPPRRITSVGLLEAGSITETHTPNPIATTVLLTTSADSVGSHGGHGFWADVVEQNGQYLVADFGSTS